MNKLTKDDCKVCSKHVTRREKGISCDICEGWYHSICTGMSDIHYNFYKNEEKINWVCTNCITTKKEENSIHDILKDIRKKSEDESENIRQERKQMLDMMKQLTEQMKKMEDKIDNKINDKLQTSEREMMIRINNELDERFEKLKRKNNIILYGIPESDGENDDDRLKEDIKKTNELFEKIEITVEKYKLIRLGNKITAEKVRPIKIEMDKEEDKHNILRGAAKIRNINDENIKKVIISSDMTIKTARIKPNLERRIENEKTGRRKQHQDQEW